MLFKRSDAALLAIIGCWMIAISTVQAKPVINWDTKALTIEALSGTSKLWQVSFTTSEALQSVDVALVPALRPYIQAMPDVAVQSPLDRAGVMSDKD